MEDFKIVYAYNEKGVYMGETQAQYDKNREVMMPPNSITAVPPSPVAGKVITMVGSEWALVDEFTPEELAKQEADALQLVIDEQLFEEQAPQRRIEEIDALLLQKSTRMLEDIGDGVPFHSSVQVLIDERKAIRATLTI